MKQIIILVKISDGTRFLQVFIFFYF